MKLLRKLRHWLTGDYWRVVRTTWPYGEGYGTYNRFRRTLADTGLTREQAEAECRILNQREGR